MKSLMLVQSLTSSGKRLSQGQVWQEHSSFWTTLPVVFLLQELKCCHFVSQGCQDRYAPSSDAHGVLLVIRVPNINLDIRII